MGLKSLSFLLSAVPGLISGAALFLTRGGLKRSQTQTGPDDAFGCSVFCLGLISLLAWRQDNGISKRSLAGVLALYHGLLTLGAAAGMVRW